MSILAIDAGTTGVTTLLLTREGGVLASATCDFAQHFPQPGWVEHDPEDIWKAVLTATKKVLDGSALRPSAIGITNQRETLVLWDKTTLQAPRRAIVWQDRRTVDLDADPARVKELTGLPLDPYFTSSKLLWVKRNEPQIFAGLEAGRTAAGTIDSYLIAKMSGGRHHITDASNASRTQLYDLAKGDWSDELLDLFEFPRQSLPTIVPSYGKLADTMPEAFLGLALPITGIAGDQQAALFGQCAFEPGEAKCTFGTGAFLLKNTGPEIAQTKDLLATVAFQTPSGERLFALEGSTFVAGAAVQWLRDGIGLIDNYDQIELEAADSSEGVIVVPALTGLGAPFWKPEATGTITGLTRGSTRAHILRATLEGIAMQVALVAEQMGELKALRVDGGASANNLLIQILADLTGVEVLRPTHVEATAIGAGYLAGLGSGLWSSQSELTELNPIRQRFTPGSKDLELIERWRAAASAI